MFSNALGIVLLTLANIPFTIQIVCAPMLQRWGWPYFRMCGLAGVATAIVLAVVIVAYKINAPCRWQWKWVVIRAFLGAASFMLWTTSSRVGTSLGDTASLASINMVVAAFLGRMFLGEALQWVHFVALGCSLGGAFLIAKPGFIFSGADLHAQAAFGYACALAAGFLQAGVAVCVRKGGDTSAWFYSLASSVISAMVYALVPYTPLIEDFALPALQTDLPLACGITFLLFVCYASAMLAINAGSKLVPAVVSSTITTASTMIFGYVSQVVIFGKALDTFNLVGAALMLAGGVVMMSGQSKENVDSRQVVDESGVHLEEIADDTDSLASFIASEFIGVVPQHQQTLRLRRIAPEAPTAGPQSIDAKSKALPDIFGAVGVVAA